MVRLELGPIASWDASCMCYRHETALVLRGKQTCEATHAPQRSLVLSRDLASFQAIARVSTYSLGTTRVGDASDLDFVCMRPMLMAQAQTSCV